MKLKMSDTEDKDDNILLLADIIVLLMMGLTTKVIVESIWDYHQPLFVWFGIWWLIRMFFKFVRGE